MDALTVDSIIKILQKYQKEGFGNLKIYHSFNTIISAELIALKAGEEGCIYLKGIEPNDS